MSEGVQSPDSKRTKLDEDAAAAETPQDNGVVRTNNPAGQRNIRTLTLSSVSSNSSNSSFDDTSLTGAPIMVYDGLAIDESSQNQGVENAEMAAVSETENSPIHVSTPDRSTTPADSEREGSVLADSLSDLSLSSSSSSISDSSNNDDNVGGDAVVAREDLAAKVAAAVTEVMNKPKPANTFNTFYQMLFRERGLSADGSRSLRNGASNEFCDQFYGSPHVVQSMAASHTMAKHTGCVNCLNFSAGGQFLCSGSDDKQVILWDWAKNKCCAVYKSGHKQNIFQAKFVEQANNLTFVTASRDGQVRQLVATPDGGSSKSKLVHKHVGAVHKLVTVPRTPHIVISAGEDGKIHQSDLRIENNITEMKYVTNAKGRRVRLFSIAHHPFQPELVVSGSDKFVRTYDLRNFKEALQQMYPRDESDSANVTCSLYNKTGTEVLASYSDSHIFLFDNQSYKSGEYMHSYKGHVNQRTIKGVNFFGPNSEFIISGSDCGNIFFWEKQTEAILNYLNGDSSGAVNCLEAHPTFPVLATSGIEDNIKIWAPQRSSCLDVSKLQKRVQRNMHGVFTHRNMGHNNFDFFIRQLLGGRLSQALDGSDDSDDEEGIQVFWSNRENRNNADDSSSSEADYRPACQHQ